MKARRVDGPDVAVGAGVLLMLWALWLWFGAPGALAFVGSMLILVGLGVAISE